MTGADYMGLVAALPCAICARLGLVRYGVEVHHRRSGTGGGRRASDFDTMPLCYEHHRDHPGSFHVLGTKRFPVVYGITETEIIEKTVAALGFAVGDIEIWKSAGRRQRRKVPKQKGGAAPRRIAGAATRWPSRRIVSRGSLRPGAGREVLG